MLLTSCDQDIVNEIYLPGGGGSVVVTDSTSTKHAEVYKLVADDFVVSEPLTTSGNSMI